MFRNLRETWWALRDKPLNATSGKPDQITANRIWARGLLMLNDYCRNTEPSVVAYKMASKYLWGPW